jgi:hypothetical protein
MTPFTWDFPYASQRMPVLAHRRAALEQAVEHRAKDRLVERAEVDHESEHGEDRK